MNECMSVGYLSEFMNVRMCLHLLVNERVYECRFRLINVSVLVHERVRLFALVHKHVSPVSQTRLSCISTICPGS